jgi:hypothetical protein
MIDQAGLIFAGGIIVAVQNVFLRILEILVGLAAARLLLLPRDSGTALGFLIAHSFPGLATNLPDGAQNKAKELQMLHGSSSIIAVFVPNIRQFHC